MGNGNSPPATKRAAVLLITIRLGSANVCSLRLASSSWLAAARVRYRRERKRWTAKAVAALKAQWKPVTAEADYHSVFEYFKRTAQDGPATAKNLTSYTIAYIAHVPLEPRAALAEWEGGKVTVWTVSQRPFGV